MTFSRLYYPSDESGGGDVEKPLPKVKNLTPRQKRDWNDMLDHFQENGIAGSKDLDKTDKNLGKDAIEKYKEDNPNSTVHPDMVDDVVNEHKQLRSGDSYAGLTPEETRVLRRQISPEFLKKDVPSSMGSAMSRMYFPEFKNGDKNYGTDASSYMKDFSGGGSAGKKSDIIPQPNYKDQKSRNEYLQKWQKKYGNLEGRGDIVLKVNEIPRGGSDTAKNLTTKFGKKYGIDPALLYSSAMEEGMSGLFKNQSGNKDTKGRVEGQPGYEDYYGDKEFPIDGGNNFGFQTFSERFPDLVKKGYLPASFASNFRGIEAMKKDTNEIHDANNFKTTDAAIQAKAAMMKYGYDYVNDYAKSKNIKLSDKAKDFFTLAWFNGGEGAVHKMVQYDKEGYLKDDKFLKEEPKEDEANKGTYKDVYGHVRRRMAMADNLKSENLF